METTPASNEYIKRVLRLLLDNPFKGRSWAEKIDIALLVRLMASCGTCEIINMLNGCNPPPSAPIYDALTGSVAHSLWMTIDEPQSIRDEIIEDIARIFALAQQPIVDTGREHFEHLEQIV